MPVINKKIFFIQKIFLQTFFLPVISKNKNFFLIQKKSILQFKLFFFHSLLSTFPQHELRRNIDLLFFIYIPCNMSDNNLSN